MVGLEGNCLPMPGTWKLMSGLLSLPLALLCIKQIFKFWAHIIEGMVTTEWYCCMWPNICTRIYFSYTTFHKTLVEQVSLISHAKLWWDQKHKQSKGVHHRCLANNFDLARYASQSWYSNPILPGWNICFVAPPFPYTKILGDLPSRLQAAMVLGELGGQEVSKSSLLILVIILFIRTCRTLAGSHHLMYPLAWLPQQPQTHGT